MFTTPEKIQLPPGAVVRLPANWQDYQAISQQLGDRVSPCLKYRPGEILLMVPPQQQYEAFTSMTMELPIAMSIKTIFIH